MKAHEIVVLVLLFVAGFWMTNYIVDTMMITTPVQRLITRIFMQFQYYILVLLVFEYRDMSRRLRRFELLADNDGELDGEYSQPVAEDDSHE